MNNPLDKLFRFPSIMLDSDNEERRKKLGLPGEEDAEIIRGESEYPYYDFVGICDRWLPTQDSFSRAKEGEFDACYVTFSNVGTILVPWNKEKFKKKFNEFIASLKADDASDQPNITFLLTDKSGDIIKLGGTAGEIKDDNGGGATE